MWPGPALATVGMGSELADGRSLPLYVCVCPSNKKFLQNALEGASVSTPWTKAGPHSQPSALGGFSGALGLQVNSDHDRELPWQNSPFTNLTAMVPPQHPYPEV